MAGHREGVGNDPDHVRDHDEHEQREHQREELHAFRPGAASDGVGHKLVAQFGHRLEAPGNELPSGDAADHQQRNQRHRNEHVGRRIGEGDLLIADVADREDLFDIELVDRINHPRGISWSAGDAGALKSMVPPLNGHSCPEPRLPLAPPPPGRSKINGPPPQRAFLSGATPADRITLITPAAKPSRKNTIRPHGDVDSKRSKPQPMIAPTTTPATSSEESRKPRAIAEALAAPFPLSVPGWSVWVL